MELQLFHALETLQCFLGEMWSILYSVLWEDFNHSDQQLHQKTKDLRNVYFFTGTLWDRKGKNYLANHVTWILVHRAYFAELITFGFLQN